MSYVIDEVVIRKEGILSGRYGERNRLSPKMYIQINNESIIDNLRNRRTRPYADYKKHLLPKALEIIREQDPALYERMKDAKWSWDKHCGCTVCPCSPGFVAKNINQPVDIWVKI